MNKLHKYPSPCLTCTRVADPESCENKNCRPWQQWFSDRWELIRAYPYDQMENTKPEAVGVSVGGRRYAHPVQVQAYIAADPCKKCSCPKILCTTPCRVRRAWVKANKEVLS